MLGTWPLRHVRINVWKASALKGKLKPFLGVDVKFGQRPSNEIHNFKNIYKTDHQFIASIDVSDVTRHKCSELKPCAMFVRACWFIPS